MNDDVALIKTHHLALAERLVANDIANLNGIQLLARRTGGQLDGSLCHGLRRRLTSFLVVPMLPCLNVIN